MEKEDCLSRIIGNCDCSFNPEENKRCKDYYPIKVHIYEIKTVSGLRDKKQEEIENDRNNNRL